MPHPAAAKAVGALILKYLLIAALSAKIAVLSVGYALYVIAAPNGESSRRKFLEHAESIMGKAQDVPVPEREGHNRDLAILYAAVRSGWKQPHELSAFGRILSFIGKSDVKNTGEALGELANIYGSRMAAWAGFRKPPAE
jgi:hypothetical protein